MNTITLPRSVVEQALEALNATMATHGKREWIEAAKQQADATLRSALEQPQGEQEPIGWVTGYYGGRCTVAPCNGATVLPVGMALYTHPQPKRQPLTQEQIEVIEAGIWNLGSMDTIERESNTQFARAIERAYGIGGEA